MSDPDNPYQSPQLPKDSDPAVFRLAGKPIYVEVIRKGFLYRSLRLTGGLEAELEWDACGLREAVSINGVTMDSHTPFWYARHFTFRLGSEVTNCQVDVDVRLYWFAPVILKAFRISIDGLTIYSEGNCDDFS